MRSNKLILLLCLLLASRAVAALNGECIIVWGEMSSGTFTHSGAAVGTHGSYDSWGSGTRSRFSIVTNDLGYSFPRPVTVSGTDYSGSAKALRSNTGAGTGDEYIEFYLPGNAAAPTVNSIATACFIRFDTSNNSGSLVNLDLFIFYPPSGNNWSVSQLQMDPSDGALHVAAHAPIGENPAPEVTQKNKTYWMRHYRNMSAGSILLTLYDPAANFALVATATIACGNENTFWMRIPSGYLGDPPGSITIGDIVMLYEPTAQELIDLVTPLPAATIGARRAGAGSRSRLR